MLKKILIAAVAVVVGLGVLAKVTKISPLVMFGDCCNHVKNMVPPETQLKQLNAEIDNIDKDIKKNLSRLARLEVEVKDQDARLEAKRTHQAKLRAEITDLQKGLEARTEKVAFRGHSYRPSELTRRLDMTVTEFTSLKENIKAEETLVVEKKRTLEAAHNRITEMKNEKEKLRLVAARLANHLETVKLNQMQSQVAIDFDDSSVKRCQQLAADIETRLKTADEEARLLKDYGYSTKNPVVDNGKSREDVLKAAKQALQDDDAADKVVEKDEK
jgi:peptidoglycan hydrolase CwlO-like protein